MGHHIDDQGRFQSDKHPDLPPDRIRVSLEAKRSEAALRTLGAHYFQDDTEFAQDLLNRLDAIHDGPTRDAEVFDVPVMLRIRHEGDHNWSLEGVFFGQEDVTDDFLHPWDQDGDPLSGPPEGYHELVNGASMVLMTRIFPQPPGEDGDGEDEA